MNLLKSLQNKWQALMPRERVVIIAGAGCVLLGLLWLVYSPLLARHSALKEQLQTLEMDAQWMQEQAGLMSQLGNSCPQAGIASINPRDFITRQAERNRLQLTLLQNMSATSTQLEATTPDGNNALLLAHQLLCQGYGLGSLKVSRTDAGNFAVTMEVNHGS